MGCSLTTTRRDMLAFLGAAAAGVIAPPARAASADHLRLGPSVGNLFADLPIAVAVDKGLFVKLGVDAEILTFNGAAKMYAALVGGAIDIAFGSGPGMMNIIKGMPAMAVAQTVGPPVEMMILVPYDSPIRNPDGLRGKHIGVSTPGGLTEWVVKELSRQKGWLADSPQIVGIGGNEGGAAALQTHSVDAVVSDAAAAFKLEPMKIARPVVRVSDYVTHFVDHVIFASNTILQTNPDVVRRFLAAWFEAVAFMRSNKAYTDRIGTSASGYDTAVESKEYELVMPAMSLDGRFDRVGLAAVGHSFVDLGLLATAPDMNKYFTEAYLPRA